MPHGWHRQEESAAKNAGIFLNSCVPAKSHEGLRIRVITTSSAESKGRIERVWNTTQDRLVPELRLNGITPMLDANRYLTQVYLPKYWHTRNTVEARDETSRYRALKPDENLNEIFCIKHTRLWSHQEKRRLCARLRRRINLAASA